jgi:hypothetical protein
MAGQAGAGGTGLHLLQPSSAGLNSVIRLRPSYGAKATAESRIPELINFGKSSSGDGKMLKSQLIRQSHLTDL